MKRISLVYKNIALAVFAVVLVSLYVACNNPTQEDAYLLVTYDKNGGDTDAIPKTQRINDATGWKIPTLLPTPPTKDGYVFIGWDTDPEGYGDRIVGGEFADDVDSGNWIESARILYAQWAEGSVSVKKNNDSRIPGFYDLEAALNSISGAGNYTVKIYENQNLTSTRTFSGSGVNVTIEAAGVAVKITRSGSGDLFMINSNASLTLGANVTLDGESRAGYGVNVGSSGTFTMKNGTISGFTRGAGTTASGGVYVNSSGKFVMDGGTISGNNAGTGDGGGIYLFDTGTVTMNGGTISGNTAATGGGVYARGIFTMNGGYIGAGNTATDNGGGVYLYSSGKFTLDGGNITNNIASSNGGGLYVQGTFILAKGAVSGNTAVNGGGVYTAENGQFTINAGTGTIDTNKASNNGGGVCVASGLYNKFTMNGGTVSKNTARVYGGGVHVDSSAFNKNAGTIIGYTSDDVNGNAVKDSSDAPISDHGHAIYVDSGRYIKRMEETADAAVILYSFDDDDNDGRWNYWEDTY